jgi:DNA (cytosine-5)-methyltransferase 1
VSLLDCWCRAIIIFWNRQGRTRTPKSKAGWEDSLPVKWTISSRKPRIYAADLFCGAGGLTRGLLNAGIDVRLGVDVDPACEHPYTANNRAAFLLKPVEKLWAEDIEPYLRKNGIRLLAGCAPCQTFSTYNQKAKPSDSRWWLIKEFSRIVQDLMPELITMENVPRLMQYEIFLELTSTLASLKYRLCHQVVNCADYGMPQNRKRLVLLASRLGPIRLLTPNEFGTEGEIKTAWDAIGGLPAIRAGQIDPLDPMHRASILSPKNLLRIKASRPGGTWRDWKPELVAKCHREDTGKTYGCLPFFGRTVSTPCPPKARSACRFDPSRAG